MSIHHHFHRHHSNRVQGPPWIAYIVFGMFALFGLTFAWMGFNTWMKAEASKTWVPVQGTVVSSDVEKHRSNKHGTTYSAEVVYAYDYNGHPYQGNKISVMQGGSGDRGAAQREADSYAPGTEVTVYVNPVDPYEAVLKPGVNVGIFVLIVFGVVFGGVGLIGLINTPNMIRAAEEKNKELGALAAGGAPSGPASTDDPLSRL